MALCPQRLLSEKEVRIVLLGKTGAGKSSLGNSLLGREAFRVARGLSSGTERCQWADEEINGISLKVTDTPGLCDTHRTEEDVLREVGKSVAVAAPGPHAVLMVLRCDRRFTEEEYEAYVALKNLFGENVVNYMVVVFAGADAFGDTPEEQREALEDELKRCPTQLREILSDASNRYLPINNKGSRSARKQRAGDIMAAVNDLIRKNGNTHFQSLLIKEVDGLKEPLVAKRMQGNHSREEATKETNLAIVQDKEPGFTQKLIHVIVEKILPAVGNLTAFVVGSVDAKFHFTSGCSLM